MYRTQALDFTAGQPPVIGYIQCPILLGHHCKCSLRKATQGQLESYTQARSLGLFFSARCDVHLPYQQHPGEAWVQGHLQLHSNFQGSLPYRAHCPPPKKRIVMWGEVEGRKKDLISEPDPASAYLPSSYIFSASVSLSVVGKWSQSFSLF